MGICWYHGMAKWKQKVCPKDPFLDHKYKGFSIFIKRIFSDILFNYFILKLFSSQNQITRWDYWGSDAFLDTKIVQIESCHILMSYASFDIKWHYWCQMMHMLMQYRKLLKNLKKGAKLCQAHFKLERAKPTLPFKFSVAFPVLKSEFVVN